MESFYRRLHHRNIEQTLSLLDKDRLDDFGLLFCGGTLISLEYGELRESTDIDFVPKDLMMFRKLRNAVSDHGLKILFKDSCSPIVKSSERSNMYGVKAFCEVGGSRVKFEIFSENRVSFEEPISFRGSSGKLSINAIAEDDRLAAKLIANVDRGMDRSGFSKDLMDILVLTLRLSDDKVVSGFKKATSVYGKDIQDYLDKTLALLQDKEYLGMVSEQLDIDLDVNNLIHQGTLNLDEIKMTLQGDDLELSS